MPETDIKSTFAPNDDACIETIPAPPTNNSLLIGVKTTDGSSLDIPSGSQIIYSSRIRSPTTQTFKLLNFVIVFFKVVLEAECLFMNSNGYFNLI